jgi:hypothetical protein
MVYKKSKSKVFTFVRKLLLLLFKKFILFYFLKKYKSTKIFKSTKVFVRKMLQKKLFFPNNHFQHTHKFCVGLFLKKFF